MYFFFTTHLKKHTSTTVTVCWKKEQWIAWLMSFHLQAVNRWSNLLFSGDLLFSRQLSCLEPNIWEPLSYGTLCYFKNTWKEIHPAPAPFPIYSFIDTVVVAEWPSRYNFYQCVWPQLSARILSCRPVFLRVRQLPRCECQDTTIIWRFPNSQSSSSCAPLTSISIN